MAVVLMAWPQDGMAVNKKTTVSQVTAPVTVSADEDYTVTSATPFADEGSIDIANTSHAVVILSSVKPSAALKLLTKITIDGQKAVNNQNCQVKLYNRGAIILPYGNREMLTVYSEPDFGGTAVSNFGTENSGGYMNTLTDAKLNNRIRSFRLKRGYMVTFSTLPRGRGYSRCFIAADADLEVSSLPPVLDGHISSYRVFKWYDTGKQQLAAAGGDNSACAALNVTSTYTWGNADEMLPDFENVPHHIYENYPSPASLGTCTSSPHLKTNNEPMNTADDPKGKTEDVDAVLANWEDLMATGMRLCSPSSWDGSDYTNGTGYLKRFIDSIDARGWRCDIIDLHCYWPENNFKTIRNWTNSTGRPVWISEWVWGASWNSNGAFSNGVTEAQNAAALKRICPVLNNNDCIERYYYWNFERDPSHLYKNGALTEAGKYYASINSGVGYNGKYDFVPTTPRQYAPTQFSAKIADGQAVITWYDHNGEYNQLMEVQRKLRGGQWQSLAVIEQKENAANYTYTDEQSPEGARYRLHLTDLNGVDHYSDYGMAEGDEVLNAAGETCYAGGNLLTNGDFDLGALDWASGNGNALSQPFFQVVPTGGFGGGSYLQAYGSGPISAVTSLKRYVAVQPNTDYLFRCASRNGGNNQQVNLCADDKTTGIQAARLKNTADWTMQTATFNSGDKNYVLIAFNTLQAKAQLDMMELRPLFKTREEALADGMKQVRVQAQTVMKYNDDPVMAALNTELQQRLDELTEPSDEALEQAATAMDELIQALDDRKAIDSLENVIAALHLADVQMPHELNLSWAVAPQYYTAEYFTSHRQLIQQALDNFLTYTDADVQPKSPNFASTTGWELKVGSYTGGDQRTNNYGGLSCWNAWWSGVNASAGTSRSMEIRQQLEALPEGLYALECKGSTQHYCLSDQHGYMVYEGDTLSTPLLTADYMDLPTVGNIWQTLTTPPAYVAEGGSVTIGFVGTKQGAIDNAWRSFGNTSSGGDRREGWWCATDFRLLYHPMKSFTMTSGKWTTVCLPYATLKPENARFYQIAGVLSDHTAIAIEEVETLEAGKPYIVMPEGERLTFSGVGESLKTPVSYKHANNLRGYFQTSGALKAPIGSYVLTDGTWVKVESTRPPIPSFSAIIYRLDGMTELEGWNGLTMPLSDSESVAVAAPTADNAHPAASYTIGGRRATNGRGLVIEVGKGQSKKVVRR